MPCNVANQTSFSRAFTESTFSRMPPVDLLGGPSAGTMIRPPPNVPAQTVPSLVAASETIGFPGSSSIGMVLITCSSEKAAAW